MGKTRKKGVSVMLLVVAAIIVLFAGIYVNHRICLGRESELLTPLGQMVEVDGHNMSVYVGGNGDKTLVFLSGGGTCSPILDFKSLYSLLSDKYRVVVVEKFGYGFSDVVDKERDIDSVLADTRAALKAVDVEGPYVLCPHSMSGIEALYWAQEYPEEVSAIIGLDMAVPEAYEDYKIQMPVLKISQFAANVGITRLIPGVSDSDAIKNGTLSDEEQAIYRAVFYKRTVTKTMLNEMKSIKANAKKVASGDKPSVPMLLFVSDGSGTGWDKESWRNYQKRYIENMDHASMIELNCPHYVHDYEYETISRKICEILE